jgi:hypothetical protein
MVADYQTRFLVLVNRCKGLSENHQIEIFTIGLRNPLKTDVELEQPTTLEEAMALAHAYEQRLAMADDPTTHTSSRSAYARTADGHGCSDVHDDHDCRHASPQAAHCNENGGKA